MQETDVQNQIREMWSFGWPETNIFLCLVSTKPRKKFVSGHPKGWNKVRNKWIEIVLMLKYYFNIKTISIHLFLACPFYRWQIHFIDGFQNPLIDSVLVVAKVSCAMCALEAIKTSEFEFGSSVPGSQSISYQDSETTISIFLCFCVVVTLTIHISTFPVIACCIHAWMYTSYGFEMKNGHLRHHTHGAFFDAMWTISKRLWN